jgi:hypothetical protein
MNIQQLHETAEHLFSKRSSLMLLWQEQAENFYPQRADFTFSRVLGTDFAGNLMTSYPMLCQRDLQDQIGTMLRPTAKEWAHVGVMYPDRIDNDGKGWLQWVSQIMRRAMYDPKAQFSKAMKEADGDYSCFGQAVTSVRINRNHDGLMYRCYHLRDVVWKENSAGVVCMVARKWKPSARDLKFMFGNKVSSNVDQMLAHGKPFEEVECMHFIVEADMYDGNPGRMPYWSI